MQYIKKDIASAWFEFGLACTMLGQYETEQDEQHLGNAFSKLGTCADRLSILTSQMVKITNLYLRFIFNN